MKSAYITPKTSVVALLAAQFYAASGARAVSDDGKTLQTDNIQPDGDAGSMAASRRRSTLWDDEE